MDLWTDKGVHAVLVHISTILTRMNVGARAVREVETLEEPVAPVGAKVLCKLDEDALGKVPKSLCSWKVLT